MKPIKYGFCTIWNEERCIRGWAKQLLALCERVTAIVDPNTTDKTVDILKTEFPAVEILWQDRSLGDTDYTHQGEKGEFIMHRNQTKFVHDNIKEGEWFIDMAADERFSNASVPILISDLKYAQKHNYGAVCHTQTYCPLPLHESQIVEENGITYAKDIEKEIEPNMFHYIIDLRDFILRHCKLEQKNPYWEHRPLAHKGYSGRTNLLFTQVPIWHFHRLKYGHLKATSWSDRMGGLGDLLKKYNGNIPILPIRMDFADWTASFEGLLPSDMNDVILQYNTKIKEEKLKIIAGQLQEIEAEKRTEEQNELRRLHRMYWEEERKCYWYWYQKKHNMLGEQIGEEKYHIPDDLKEKYKSAAKKVTF